MAKAGSCKIGFNPNPSVGVGLIALKGFELNNIKNKKPKINKFWIYK